MKLLDTLIKLNLITFILSKSFTYSSTFEITGGIYTKKTWECPSAPTFKVSIGISECEAPIDHGLTLEVDLIKKGFFFDQTVSSDNVNLHYGGDVTLTGNEGGEYIIYLHNESSHRVKGSIDLDITC